MLGATAAGRRYVRAAAALQAVLVRIGVFMLGASALWAVLPIMARNDLSKEEYGTWEEQQYARGARPRPPRGQDRALSGPRRGGTSLAYKWSSNMQYTPLGRTGLQVSRLCRGTMNFGPQTSEAACFTIRDQALEQGLNFFDTTNAYGNFPPPGPGGPANLHGGLTEEIIGRWRAQGSPWVGAAIPHRHSRAQKAVGTRREFRPRG